MTDPTILWFRQDLRLSDQRALIAAAGEGPVVPVYVLDDDTAKHRKMGGASRWWLHHSLAALDGSLREKGSRLILRRGTSDAELAKVAEDVGAGRVHCIRHYEPWWRNAERAVAKELDLVRHDGNYLAPPGSVTTGGGTAYKIYTPFWRALNEVMPPPEPLNRPRDIPAPSDWPESDDLDDWNLLPTKPNWATGFDPVWTPGEDGARARIDSFLDRAADYDERRNLPHDDATSRLSPHLHFGEVSPGYVWHRTADAGGSVRDFLGELGWRDYAENIVLQFPDYPATNGRDKFEALAWRDLRSRAVRDDYDAWTTGRTGYPIVDAGMRQLWATGWMHNRVRMVAASFVIKHLLIDWREGERWFWDTLVDADYASNGVNWQWVAGTGVDANMFGRIMAPLRQSQRFDAGDYIRHWVPELADVPDDAIHDPEDAGCRPEAYPEKRIGHREARARALEAVKAVR